jgi:prolyl-tRNA editing enzyme YbaK/EbsC (Cys-tRNA(Pro) deacylase)
MAQADERGAERVAAALAAAGLADRLKSFAQTTHSAAEAAEAIGCPLAAIAKSIVLRAADGRAVVAVLSGAARVDEKKLAAAIGMPAGKADARFVRERTGYAIGGVSPLALPDDVVLLIDRGLFALPTIWAAAGTPFAVWRTSADELRGLTGGLPTDLV